MSILRAMRFAPLNENVGKVVSNCLSAAFLALSDAESRLVGLIDFCALITRDSVTAE